MLTMALSPCTRSPFSLDLLYPTSPLPSSLNNSNPCNSFRALKFKLSCSSKTIQLDTQQIKPTKKKRKPRPSFLEQVQDKWSVKTTSLREKFPWEEQNERELVEEEQEEDKESQEFDGVVVAESRIDSKSSVSDPVISGYRNGVKLAPWVQRSKPKSIEFDFEARNLEKKVDIGKRVDRISRNYGQESNNLTRKYEEIDGDKVNAATIGKRVDRVASSDVQESKNLTRKFKEADDYKFNEALIGYSEKIEAVPVNVSGSLYFKGQLSSIDKEIQDLEDSSDECQSIRLQLEREGDGKSVEQDKLRGRLPWEKEIYVAESNTMLAEKMIPEPELKRLRNVAVRMVERIKVGKAGITQALVDSIHDKWKDDEVVKLKFEGPTIMNMKRSHEILEVSVVFRVLTYSKTMVLRYPTQYSKI